MRQPAAPRRQGPALASLASLAALAAAAALLAGCSGSAGPAEQSDGSASPSEPRTAVTPSTAPPKAAKPGSVAAVGDSITRGFDACELLSDCPEVSWVTGTDKRVDSFASRLGTGTGDTWNLARSGARMADLPGQVGQAVAKKPDLIAVLMGANDACSRSTEAMTPVADFRADFESSLKTVHTEAPDAQVLVASIPDLERLWEIGRRQEEAKQVWAFGICPSMLARPDSDAEPDRARRAEVGKRVDEYNEVLETACAEYNACRFDGGAVHRYEFTERDLSPLDWFHPSVRGQATLARILYGVAFRKG